MPHRDGHSRTPPALLTAVLTAALATAVLLAGCGGADDDSSATPSASPPATSPAGGTRPAPGLYELADGTVAAVGAVEYRDLEGGFWVVVAATGAPGDAAETVAVLANGEEFAAQFRAYPEGLFEVRGERAGDVSVRMAGPEITASSVTLLPEGGPAD